MFVSSSFPPLSSSCDICQNSISIKSSSSNKNQATSHNFFVLVSRFLNLSSDYFKPNKTLSNNVRNGAAIDGQICDNCLPALDSFCQMYDLWFCLQLEMGRCLQEVSEFIRTASDTKAEKPSLSSNSCEISVSDSNPPDIGQESINPGLTGFTDEFMAQGMTMY